MSNRFSILISAVFHPIFVNLTSLVLLFILFPYLRFGLNDTLKFYFVLFIFLTTGFVPLIAVLLLKLLGKAKSIMLDDMDERTIPYLLTSSLYLFSYFFFQKIDAPYIIRAYLLACSCIVLLVLIINLYSKISIHCASLGALTGVLFAASQIAPFDVRIALAIAFIITGLTATARLFANSHDYIQILSGYFLGLIIMLLIL